MKRLAIGAVLLLVVAGIVSAAGYALKLPRPIALVGLVCLVVGATAALGAGFVNARRDDLTVARSISRSVKDTLRLVIELVP
jgi:hypothetical protein